MNALLRITVVFLLFQTSTFAEVLRDYSKEPGITPFKEVLGQNLNETIDPFGGTLQHKYLDVSVPGNGGMDINIYRTYTSLNRGLFTGELDVNEYHSILGAGWSMHFGRFIFNGEEFNNQRACYGGDDLLTTKDNPSLEFPDGSRELLVRDLTNNYLITRSRWKVECIGSGLSAGVRVSSPDGTVYIMDRKVREAYGNSVQTSIYTSKITDKNGNTLDFSFASDIKLSADYKYVSRITASNGRVVDFIYVGVSGRRLLSEIRSNNQVWKYEYISDVNSPVFYQLSRVILPRASVSSPQREWKYSYYPSRGVGLAGSHSLQTVTYPYGATITYDYAFINFNMGVVGGGYTPTTSVVSKTVKVGSFNAVAKTYNWTFIYEPGVETSAVHERINRTTVISPVNKIVYKHFGYYNALTNTASLWMVGLLAEKLVYDLNDNLVSTEDNVWNAQKISDEQFFHGRSTSDFVTYTPTLGRKLYIQDGAYLVTDYQSYDQYGNATQIDTRSNYIGKVNTTNLTYNIDPAKWIIHQVKNESINTIGTISRIFDTNGNLSQLNEYGIVTNFTYYPTGDIFTSTNAKNITTTYRDYFRGIARTEELPESILLNRTVNPTGTLASETNGRRFTKSYTYDGLNRLESITFPINTGVSISRDFTRNGKTVTRGNYQVTNEMDGFGRSIAMVQKDLLTNEEIRVTSRYDAMGNKLFESYPNSGAGTNYKYDALNRLIRITHPDGSFKSFNFNPGRAGLNIDITDERQNTTSNGYIAYGSPENKYLIEIRSAENIFTQIERDVVGQITGIWQGPATAGGFGYQYSYFYNLKRQLERVESPEIGLVSNDKNIRYTYDAVGNMSTRTVSTLGATTYTYDNLNRNTLIDYPGTTPDVNFTYDNNGNVLTVTNSNSVVSYSYDNNDNKLTENLFINARNYLASYTYNGLDNLASIKYPSTQVVNYAPDAFGRARQVAPYLTNVSYHPSGQVAQMVYANGAVTDYSINQRLWVDGITTNSTTSVVNLGYLFDNKGNISSISNGIDFTYDRSFGYDGVDRLTSASGAWGVGSIVYDELGNITKKDIGTTLLNYSYASNVLTAMLGEELSGSTVVAVDRSYSYDDYGNITDDKKFSHLYDDAGNLIKSDFSISVAKPPGINIFQTYQYDGNNMRVASTDSGETKRILDTTTGKYVEFIVAGTQKTKYFFNTGNNLLGEYGTSIADQKEYIYLGSQMIASVKGGLNPVVNLPSSMNVTETDVVTLNVSGSYDPDGFITGYNWRQLSGPTINIANPSSAILSFTTPYVIEDTIYIFEVTVTDNDGNTTTATTTITVSFLDTDSDGLSDYWEITYFGGLTQTASGDADQDYYTNLEEFKLGLDPTVPQVPDTPTGLTLVPDMDFITLGWIDVRRATNYNIYWSETRGVTPLTGTKIVVPADPMVAGSQLTYLHQNLLPNHRYYYIIVAENIGGESLPTAEKVARAGWRVWTTPTVLDNRNWDMFKNYGGYLNDPVMAGDKKGAAITVWQRKNNPTAATVYSIVAQEHTRGNGWKPRINLVNTNTDLSRYNGQNEKLFDLDMNKNQVGAFIWNEAGIINIKRYENGWQSATRIDEGLATAGSLPSVNVFGNGDIIAVWDNHSNYYKNGAGWQGVITIDVNLTSTLGSRAAFGLTGPGKAIYIWDVSSPIQQFLISEYTYGVGWSLPVSINPGNTGSINRYSLKIATTESGTAIIGWSQVQQSGIDGYWVKRYNRLTGWGLSIVLDSNYNGQSDVAINSSGRAVVAISINSSSSSDDLKVMTYIPGSSGWSIPTTMRSMPLDPLVYLYQQKVMSINLQINDNGAIVIMGRVSKPIRNNAINDTFAHRYEPDFGWLESPNINNPYNGKNIPNWNDGSSATNPVFVLDNTDSVIAVWGYSQQYETPDEYILSNRYERITKDTIAPVLTPPANLVIEATDVLTPVNLGTAIVLDNIDTNLVATADNTGPFALGTYTITWSATDTSGNVGTATQLLTVQDTSPPVLTLPPDITVLSDIALAIDIGTASATDVSTPVVITNDAPALFPVGITTVTWTATDSKGYSIIATQSVTVTTVSMPDLSISTISTPNTSAELGQSIPITFSVQNTGNNSSVSGTTLRFYISSDPVIDINDISPGRVFVETIAAGATVTQTTNIVVNSSLIPGTYYIGAIIDPDNINAETNETNNALTGSAIEIVQIVDLSVSSISTPNTSAELGQSIPLTFSVQNTGSSSSRDKTTIRFYLSSDPVIEINDTSLGRIFLGTVAAGSTNTQTTNVVINSSLIPGTYYLGAIVDPENRNAETDETNNALTGSAIEIVQIVDLSVSSITTPNTSAELGQSIPLTFSVKNTETSSSRDKTTIRFYFSSDPVIDINDTSPGRIFLGTVAAGATVTQTINIGVNSSLTSGTYYIGAIVDPENRNAETDETNNTLTGSAIEIVQIMDLSISSLTTSNTSAVQGQSIPITFSVINTGTSSSRDKTTMRVYLSTDAVIDINDISPGSIFLGTIVAGATLNQTSNIVINSNLTPGTYYLGAIVDPGNLNTETDETNNAITGTTISVTAVAP